MPISSPIPGPRLPTHSPITRPQPQISSPISGPSALTHRSITEPQASVTTEHLLHYLVAVNGHSMVQSTPEVPKLAITLSPSSSSTSEQPFTCSGPDPNEEQETHNLVPVMTPSHPQPVTVKTSCSNKL